jgi:peptidylprolyl isomerase
MKFTDVVVLVGILSFAVRAAEPPRVTDERLVLQTVGGDIVLAFYADAAPRHVEHVLRLARLGVFDTTHFVRLDPQGYYVQLSAAEDRLVPATPAQRTAAAATVAAEFGKLRHVRGALSMAHAPGQPDGATTSFSILRASAPHLDPPNESYTIFGHVERGLEVVDHLASLRKRDGDAAPVRLTVLKAVVVTAGELGAMQLRGPELVQGTAPGVAGRAGAAGDREGDIAGGGNGRALGFRRAATGGFIAVGGCALLAFFFARKLPGARRAVSFSLLGLLTAGLMVLMLLVPVTWNYRWLGVALLVALLAIIKAMTFFDAER